MNRIDKLREFHNQELEKYCLKNEVSFPSIQRLLEAERAKKLMKKSAYLQTNIEKELNNNIEHEN